VARLALSSADPAIGGIFSHFLGNHADRLFLSDHAAVPQRREILRIGYFSGVPTTFLTVTAAAATERVLDLIALAVLAAVFLSAWPGNAGRRRVVALDFE
jgi:hypothetical protein